MIVYKYTTCDKFDRVLDIIEYRRLFCAEIDKLNDPMEGLILFSAEQFIPDGDSALETEKKRAWFYLEHQYILKQYRVCSLSKICDNILMWSHYCSGHTGLCIEIDLPDHTDVYREITYVESIEKHQEMIRLYNPIAYLHYKLDVWDYEQEVRIIQYDKYYDIADRIKRIIFGSKISPVYLNTIKRITGEDIKLAVAYINKSERRMDIFDL